MTRLPVAVLVIVALLGSASTAFPQAGGRSSVGRSSGPTPSRPAPSGGVATGKPASGPETPAQKVERKRMKKNTVICKGC